MPILRSKLLQFCLLLALTASLAVLSSCGGGGGGGGGGDNNPIDNNGAYPVFSELPADPFDALYIHMNVPVCLNSLTQYSVLMLSGTEPYLGQFMGAEYSLTDGGLTIVISRAGGWDPSTVEAGQNRFQIIIPKFPTKYREDVNNTEAWVRTVDECGNPLAGYPPSLTYRDQFFYNTIDGKVAYSSTDPIFVSIVNRDTDEVFVELINGTTPPDIRINCGNVWQTSFDVQFRDFVAQNFTSGGTWTWINGSRLEGNLPALTQIGAVDLKLLNGTIASGGGDSTAHDIFTVTFAGAPIVDFISPTSASDALVQAGISIQVSGDRFTGGMTVRFDDATPPISNLNIIDQFTATFTLTGAFTLGDHTLTFENPGGGGGETDVTFTITP